MDIPLTDVFRQLLNSDSKKIGFLALVFGEHNPTLNVAFPIPVDTNTQRVVSMAIPLKQPNDLSHTHLLSFHMNKHLQGIHPKFHSSVICHSISRLVLCANNIILPSWEDYNSLFSILNDEARNEILDNKILISITEDIVQRDLEKGGAANRLLSGLFEVDPV